MIAEITETREKAQVTHEDILNGHRCNMYSCPIALSIQRSIPNVSWVKVWGSVQVCFENGDMIARHLTEQEQLFINAFDAGLDVEPIEIEIPRLKIDW